MQRRDYIIKWLLYVLVALLFVLVRIRVWGVHPFVFPAMVAILAALESPHESAIFALAFGVVLDLTVPGVIPCFYTVSFIVIFIVSRLLSTRVLSWPFFCCMLFGTLSIVCADLLNMLFLKAYVSFSLKTALLLTGKELLLTMPLLPLLYLPVYRIRRIFRPD